MNLRNFDICCPLRCSITGKTRHTLTALAPDRHRKMAIKSTIRMYFNDIMPIAKTDSWVNGEVKGLNFLCWSKILLKFELGIHLADTATNKIHFNAALLFHAASSSDEIQQWNGKGGVPVGTTRVLELEKTSKLLLSFKFPSRPTIGREMFVSSGRSENEESLADQRVAVTHAINIMLDKSDKSPQYLYTKIDDK